MNKKRVSFDFDGTLTRVDVQEFCKELIEQGVEVFVTTMRYNEMLKHIWIDEPSNDLLFNITKYLGIPIKNIIFTNMLPKSIFLEGSDVLFHLDDDRDVEFDIKSLTKIPCVMVQDDYKTICKIILNEFDDERTTI